jgi:hypothetical protein
LDNRSTFNETLTHIDREEALKDDYPLAGSTYDEYDDAEDEWAGDDSAWTEEPENDESDGKDESSAYLEFLNEEVINIISIFMSIELIYP